MTKVAVMGAGAVGSMFGGLIKHHAPELDVLLIARGEHGEQMRRQGGVTLKGGWGAVDVPLAVSDTAADLANSDYVLLTVKSHSTEEAIRLVVDHVRDATVISIQNGINQRILSEYIPPERLVMGLTATVIAIHDPGTVVMERDGPTAVGPSSTSGALGVVQTTAGLLKQSRLKIVTNPNILGAQFNKLVFNSLGAASSLSASDFLGEAVLYRPWRDAVGVPLQRESLNVLAQAGIRLSRIPSGADAFRFRRLLRTLNQPVIGPVTEFMVRKLLNPRPLRFSVHRDLSRGKPTEVDFINGEIVRLAVDHGTHAPLNAKVLELVHQIERRKGFFARDEVISMFRSIHS